jgi:hypothetical protein
MAFLEALELQEVVGQVVVVVELDIGDNLQVITLEAWAVTAE